MVSSPTTEPLAEEIVNSKLGALQIKSYRFAEFVNGPKEPVLIPRSRQIGGSSGITPHILAKKTFVSLSIRVKKKIIVKIYAD